MLTRAAMAAAGLLALAVFPRPAAAEAAAPAPKFNLPLACQIGRTCEVQNYLDRDPGPAARDYRCGAETYQGHNGIDFRVPDMAAQARGVAVLAAAPGRVARLRDGVPDISIRAPNAPPLKGQDCGNGVIIDHGGGWESQYCHLARGSIAVKVGQPASTGTVLGRVGLSGNTEFPHVHLTIRHNGQVVDPFDPDMGDLGGCRAKAPLWSPGAMAQLGYKTGAVLNAGFAAAPIDNARVEAGGVPGPTTDAPYLVAYVRAIGLQAGDVIALELRSPTGARLAQSRLAPLDHSKAQHLAYIGVKRPPGGWPAGTYKASYLVLRQGKAALNRSWDVRLGG